MSTVLLPPGVDPIAVDKYIYISYIYYKRRRIRWVGNVTRMGEKRTAYRVLVGKSEGKQPPGRPRCRLEDSILDLKRIWKGGRALKSPGSRQGKVTDPREHVNECSGFKIREIS
jgi:hypothetical protein